MQIIDLTHILKEFDDVEDELDFLFNNQFKTRRPVLMPMERGWKPMVDMYETEEEIVITFDLAGISTNDVKLLLHGNNLIIRGIRREPNRAGKRHFHKMEIDFGPFERKIELPTRIDPTRVIKRYSQGFYEIRLPKMRSGRSGKIVIEIK